MKKFIGDRIIAEISSLFSRLHLAMSFMREEAISVGGKILQ